MATGMAMYAIQTSNTESDFESAMARATQFLISTQKTNGSWDVPGTKTNTKDRPTPTANYWGTAWAVIGLLEKAKTLP